MKLRIMSDIHLDSNTGWTPPRMEDEAEQVLILAGDVALFCTGEGRYDKYDWFWKEVTERFDKVFYVPGNHDYYRGDILRVDIIMRDHLGSMGVEYLQRDIVEYKGVTFAGTTLWTNFGDSYEVMRIGQRYMTDYRVTKIGKRLMEPMDIMAIHKANLEFVKYAAMTSYLEVEGIKVPNVLITPHLPNKDFVAPRWINDDFNELYHADVDWNWLDLFDLVICGHTHDTIDFMHNDTRAIINPKGYPHEHHEAFNPRLVVEV